MKYRILILVASIWLFSCTSSEITPPPPNSDANLVGTKVIDGTVMKKMEGIYALDAGSDNLGVQFVCKVSKYKVSFFSNHSGIFIILKYGLKSADGSIQFSGFWRYSESSGQGNIQFSLAASDGATDLLNGIVTSLKIKGQMESGPALTLKYTKPFSTYAIQNEFMIFAHHGVQTTVDPPYAENSVDGVLHDEDYGVNGLEFDVRMTKDNVPICIHDPTINTRLTLKGPLSGNWNQYSFPFLTDYVRLVDGQQLPSVAQVLDAFVESTTLKYMWLDIKGDPNIFKYLEPIIRNAYAKAAAKNRTVTIFAGLPSDDVIQDFKNNPSYGLQASPLPTLCELSVDKAIENKSSFFGPRFTEGLLLPDVEKAHSHGIKVISWTLNSKNLVASYMKDGKFDGFITDYPAYIVYEFYTKY